MEQQEFEGVLSILSKFYPCDENGAIDEESYRRYIRWLIEAGVNGIGDNIGADFDYYSDAERLHMDEILIEEVNNCAMTFIGVSSWDMLTAVKRAKDAARIGADVIFFTGPPYDRPFASDPKKGMLEFFKRMCDAVDQPLAFYNTDEAWPGIMNNDLLMAIDDVVDRIVYVKAGTRELNTYKEMIDGLQSSKLRIIAGKSYFNFHQLNYAWKMSNRPIGMGGYICSLLPKEHVAMWQAFKRGEIETARTIWLEKILPLADLLYGTAFDYHEKFIPMEVLKQLGILKSARIPQSIKPVDEYMRGELGKALSYIRK
jgi:dihydrodipicolinate synthase/N-acetylneuraminate lyase